MKKLLMSLHFIFIVFAAQAMSQTDSQIQTYSEQQTTISLHSNQPEFSIKLKSNPTTGYSWFLRDYDDTLVKPIKHHFIASTNKKLMGAPGFELWIFKATPQAFLVPQQTTIRFVYARPWQKEKGHQQIVFKVMTNRLN